MAFHDQWAGVKIALAGVTSVPQSGSITDLFGQIILAGTTTDLPLGPVVYYSGRLAGSNVCHALPSYASATTTFTAVSGFSYLPFCTWTIQAGDRCADLTPSSSDCTSSTECAP
jgi:hypothetical protein